MKVFFKGKLAEVVATRQSTFDYKWASAQTVLLVMYSRLGNTVMAVVILKFLNLLSGFYESVGPIIFLCSEYFCRKG